MITKNTIDQYIIDKWGSKKEWFTDDEGLFNKNSIPGTDGYIFYWSENNYTDTYTFTKGDVKQWLRNNLLNELFEEV